MTPKQQDAIQDILLCLCQVDTLTEAGEVIEALCGLKRNNFLCCFWRPNDMPATTRRDIAKGT